MRESLDIHIVVLGVRTCEEGHPNIERTNEQQHAGKLCDHHHQATMKGEEVAGDHEQPCEDAKITERQDPQLPIELLEDCYSPPDTFITHFDIDI
jgi:hypothetical protein